MIMEKRKEIGRWYTKDKEGEKFYNGSKRWKKPERELKKKKKKKKKKKTEKKREHWDEIWNNIRMRIKQVLKENSMQKRIII